MKRLCVDDFGCEVYECRYTKAPVWADIGVVIGPFAPGVKAKYIMHPDAKEAHRQSGINFHESEANCNTCTHLVRVQREKNRAGFLYGRCANPSGQPSKSPYANRQDGDVMVFHPDDPMHMPCYVSRWADKLAGRTLPRPVYGPEHPGWRPEQQMEVTR